MNEIRLNKEEEKVIVQGRFKTPKWLVCLMVVSFILFVGLLIAGFKFLSFAYNDTADYDDYDYYDYYDYYDTKDTELGVAIFLIVLSFCCIVLSILFVVHLIRIRNSSCTVTNKRVYGVTNIYFIRKNYSYRLDEIYDVETVSSFGINSLVLSFSQGYGAGSANGAETFKINHIENIDELFQKLSSLITGVKNNKDLMVDIEMSKINVEERKAVAFENLANNMVANQTQKTSNSNHSYIEELTGLKKLLDNGIITEEEFNEKKKSILK